MTERFAIYYAPDPASPFWQRAATWLGRDAATGALRDQSPVGLGAGRLRTATGTARRYGFHATLKAPMALAAGTDAGGLEAALGRFCGDHAPVVLGPLALRILNGTLALVPAAPVPELKAFAASCVLAFEPFRAPSTPAESARRRDRALTPRQLAMFERYGYSFVGEEFHFHMTLTDRLAVGEQDAFLAAARAFFARDLAGPHVIDRVSLFVEPEEGAPFLRRADYALTTLSPV